MNKMEEKWSRDMTGKFLQPKKEVESILVLFCAEKPVCVSFLFK